MMTKPPNKGVAEYNEMQAMSDYESKEPMVVDDRPHQENLEKIISTDKHVQ